MTNDPMKPQRAHGSIARRCTATSKRSGQRCRKSAMRGRTTCRNHGGASPRGVAHPSFKTGRHSRDLPTRLIERVRASARDPQLLSLQDEIALLDARTGELLAALPEEPDTEADRQIWREIRLTLDQRQRLADAERKRLVSMQQMLSVEQAMVFVAAVSAAVKRHVHDDATLRAIGREIEAFTSANVTEDGAPPC